MLKMQILVMIINLYPILTKTTFCGMPPMCCPGYKWKSENKSCIACDPGYYGINCNNKCIFPSYGIRCQLECRCKKSLCHHSIGCEVLGVSTAPITKILESSTNLVTKELEEEQKTKRRNILNILTKTAANTSTTTEIGEEKTTNEEYISRQEEKSRRKNMTIFLSTIGLSAIAVTLACIHIVLCFVDVDVCWRKPGDLDL